MHWGRILLACSRFAVVTPLTGWLLVLAALALGGRVAGWQWALGLVAGAVAIGDRRMSVGEHAVAAGISLGVLAAGLVASVVLPDPSWDANMYHFPATLALADGWNPIWERHSPLAAAWAPPDAAAWVRHYPKALWMWSASLYAAVPNVDAGKAVNWLAWLLPVGPAFVLFRHGLRCRPAAAVLGAGLAASSPVTICQLTSGYLDGAFAGLLTAFVFAAAAGVQLGVGRLIGLAGLAAVLLINVKFTGLVYVVVCGGAVLVYALIFKRKLVRAWTLGMVIVLVVGPILGFDSYGLNAIEHRNPFHPAWTPQGGSVIASQTSPEFRARNRLDQLIRSIGARQMSPPKEQVTDPVPRLPFVGVKWSHRCDARFAGFGPFFWEALLFSLLLVPARRRAVAWLAILAVLASTLATEAAWWARLAPQVWLLPLCLAWSARPRAGRWRVFTRVTGVLVAALLVVDVTLVGFRMARYSTKFSTTWYGWIVQDIPEPGLRGFLDNESLRRCVERRALEVRSNQALTTGPGSPASMDVGWWQRARLGLGLGR